MQSEENKLLRFAAKMKAPSARSLGGKGFSEELVASNSASPRSWAFGTGPQICKFRAYGTLGAAQYSKRVSNSSLDGRPTSPSAQPLSRTTKLPTLRRMRRRAGCALGPHPRPRLRLSQRPASSHVFTQIRVGMRIVRRIARVKRNCPQSDQTGDSFLLTLHKCTPLSMYTALLALECVYTCAGNGTRAMSKRTNGTTLRSATSCHSISCCDGHCHPGDA